MDTWVVLLRGINVGGKNVIAMRDLRDAFVRLGFDRPETYIQSGNVLVDARTSPSAAAARRIERGLATAVGYNGRVAILDRAQLRTVVAEIPAGWDAADKDMRYHVLFPVSGLPPAAVVEAVRPKPDLESVSAGTHAVYWSAPFATLTRTTMVKLSAHPLYPRLTVRNLSTTRKLLALVDARG